MTIEQWKSKGDFFRYESHTLFYREKGEGEALLLIHGFPTASWDWWQLFDPLAKHYRVFAFDMLGFGFSDKPKGHRYSIMEQADIVEHFLTIKGIESVRIIAHDYGDTVAQEMLARHNSRSLNTSNAFCVLRSICLLNGGLFPETHRPLFIQTLLMSPLGKFISPFFTKKKLAQNFARIFGSNTQPSQEDIDQFWALITHNNGKRIFHLLIRYMAERSQYRSRWVNALQHTKVPLRLINGVEDPISGQHMVDRYRQLIPKADVVELSAIGHFPLIEAPMDVLKHYLAFSDQ